MTPAVDPSSYLSQTLPIAVSMPSLALAPPIAISVPPIIIAPPIGGPPPIIVGPPGNAGLLGSLSYVGVVTSPVAVFSPPMLAPLASTSSFAQLHADVQKLQSELESLAAKSGVSIADLQSLTSDGQAISQAGFQFNSQSLKPVISELATAVAGGSSTAQAQSEFTALFSGSTVSASVITTTFNDLVKTIQDSKVTSSDLSAVAGDEAAIQTDLNTLHPVIPVGTGTGSGTKGGGTSGTGSPGTTGGSSGTGHHLNSQHHKTPRPGHALVHSHTAVRSHALESHLRKRG